MNENTYTSVSTLTTYHAYPGAFMNSNCILLLMIRTLVFLLSALTLAAEAPPDQLIRAVLERQQVAWNSGDIRGFMEGYADDCVFAGATLTRGYDAVMDRYLKRYPSRDKMGALASSD